jgi:hypothetical protein
MDSVELPVAELVLVLEGVCCAANHLAPALQRESYTDLWQTRASTYARSRPVVGTYRQAERVT